jgi:hypothetical protein
MAVEVDCSLSLGSANVEQTYFVPFSPDAFPLSNRCAAEIVFLQFRKMLEQIAFASLVAQRHDGIDLGRPAGKFPRAP